MEVWIRAEVDDRHLATWSDATQAPAVRDYVNVNGKTWIVHRRVWRPGGNVDVYCGAWEFNL